MIGTNRNQKLKKDFSYRFRIGDYRVVFDIDDNNVVILRIGHRKSIGKSTPELSNTEN